MNTLGLTRYTNTNAESDSEANSTENTRLPPSTQIIQMITERNLDNTDYNFCQGNLLSISRTYLMPEQNIDRKSDFQRLLIFMKERLNVKTASH